MIVNDGVTGDLVGVRQVRQRACYQLVIEIDESEANRAIEILGGLPQESTSRSVFVTLSKNVQLGKRTAK